MVRRASLVRAWQAGDVDVVVSADDRGAVADQRRGDGVFGGRVVGHGFTFGFE